MPEVERVTFSCTACGGSLFSGVGEGAKPDDQVACAGCGRVIGTFAEVQQAVTEAAKAEMEKALSKAFGKPIKPDWRSE